MARGRALRLTATFAILALVVKLFAPALAHAAMSAGAAPWLEICSETGLVTPLADPAHDGVPGQNGASSVQHCPLCAPSAGTFLAPPPAPAFLFAVPPGRMQSPAATDLPVVPPVWRGAGSRAPPSL